MTFGELAGDFAPEFEVGPIFAGEDKARAGWGAIDRAQDGLGDIARVADTATAGGSEGWGTVGQVADHAAAAGFPVPWAEHEAWVDDDRIEPLSDGIESFFFGCPF